MAQINCNGDCLNCTHRLNAEVNPSECASMYGFIHIQQSMKDMRVLAKELKEMHSMVMVAIQNITPSVIEPSEPKEFVFESPLLAETEEVINN